MTQIFFTDNNHLWESDGTAAGSHQVSDDVLSMPRGFAAAGGVVFFTTGSVGFNIGNGPDLWRSDGTDGGTYAVATGLVNQPSVISKFGLTPVGPPSGIGSLESFGGTLFFAADDGTHGVELWVSDGSRTGTHLLKDINPGRASGMTSSVIELGGFLYFAADDGTHGAELWKTDGTATGTGLVSDFSPGKGSTDFSGLTSLNGRLIFSSFDGATRLRSSDATAEGTVTLATIDGSFTLARSKLFFNAHDAGGQSLIGTSDGTAAGTRTVGFVGADPRPVATLGDRLFFTAFTSATGTQLWVTDGTAGGTQRLTDVSGTFFVSRVAAASTELFFTAFDPVHGSQLWKSDGTAAGTLRATDFLGTNPSSTNGQAVVAPLFLKVIEDTAFFTLGQSEVTSGGNSGTQLFATDNSTVGFHEVISLPRGGFRDLTAIDGKLYFAANDGNGIHPFVSDGTPGGTRELVTLAGSIEAGTFFQMPDRPAVITAAAGTALASFDTAADLILDLRQADQPQSLTLSGNDTIMIGAAATTITATAGNDVITVPTGATGGLTFVALGGNDTINAASGNNSLTGGPGHAVFRLSGGNEYVKTGSGTASIEITGGDNTIVASQGSASISNSNAPLLLGLLGGSHQVALADGTPIVLATGGSSTISASGAPAAPMIGVFGGTHQINMGAGGDTVFGVGGDGTINGGAGINAVDLVTGHLQVNAGPGITELFVNGGDNTLLLQSNGGLVLVSGFDPAHLHFVIASHINGQVFTDPSQIASSHLADGSLLLDLGSGANGPEQVLLVGTSSIASSAITLV